MDLLSEAYLGYKPVSIETLIGKKGKNQQNMRDIAPEEIVDYACEDADITLQLKHRLWEMMDEDQQKVFNDIEAPLVAVLANMEQEGINLDVPTLKKRNFRFIRSSI